MAQLNFNAENVAPSQSFELMPIHWAQAQIVSSEMKPTKSGTGQYLELTLEIMGGEFNARNLWVRLNLISQSTQATEIAQADLSKICRALNTPQITDSVQLHRIPLDIKIGLEKPREGYDQRNEIKDFAQLGKHTQAAGAPQQHPIQPAPQPAPTRQHTADVYTQPAPQQPAPAPQPALTDIAPGFAPPPPAMQANPIQQQQQPAPTAPPKPDWS